MRRFSVIPFRAILVLILLSGRASGASTVDYNRDIRPILADHCFHCHGPDEKTRKGGLRLDSREDALKGGKSDGPAIVDGNPARSPLVARLLTKDEDDLMPPPKEKHPVSAAGIELLKRWILEGAPYAKHWAFEAPVKAGLAERSISSRNPVDFFVGQRLAKEGLKPQAAATPEQICRRLYLDILGLPPSPAQVDEFVRQARRGLASAVAELASGLLQKPGYGEKWARHWLDAARYADSNGYEKDLPREQWAWRDWVIESLNRDQPYNQFIVEQVAGDLLPDRSERHLVATGYLRNGMINEEGAIIPELFRMEGLFDRIDTLGKSVLGLTLQCAQCHSHKFDPISQTEYYGLLAFLNNTHEAQSWVYSESQKQKIAGILAGTAAVEKKIKTAIPDWESRIEAWEKTQLARLSQIQWSTVHAEDLHSTSELNHPTSLPDGSILTLGHRTIGGDVYMIAEPKVEAVTGLRLEILKHGDLPFGGPGRSFKGTWALTELIFEVKRPGTNKWEPIRMTKASADYSESEGPMEPEWANKSSDKDGKRIRGPVGFMVDTNDLTAWRADRGLGRCNTESVAVAQFESPLTLPPGTKIKISLRLNHGGDDNGPKNVMIGRFRVSLTQSPDPSALPVDYAAVLAMQTPRDRRSASQQSAVFSAWRRSPSELQAQNNEIETLWKDYPAARTSVLHLTDRSPEDPRQTSRLDRGQWDRPKEPVVPHVPSSLHPLPPGAGADRLGFARWLVDERSPLTARVVVNRVWQSIFGRGLVETPEDFGLRGAEPSHRELLDWLAVDFMEHGWSQKHLIRTIVNSEVYRQSSRATPILIEKDPSNRLISRGPRFRADAEVVRDIALKVSGLLTEEVGGPSIFPPVPQNVLEFNFFRPDYWIAATGPERYRRSLYVFRKRSMPDPALSAFDAPNADIACARRPRSNTPLAALTSLNEPVFVEASQALAMRILKEGGPTDSDRVNHAFRLCVGRPARAAEKAEVLKLLASRRKQLSEGWLPAGEIATGESARVPSLPAGATPRDAAAWTIVSRVLLNLDETMTKN